VLIRLDVLKLGGFERSDQALTLNYIIKFSHPPEGGRQSYVFLQRLGVYQIPANGTMHIPSMSDRAGKVKQNDLAYLQDVCKQKGILNVFTSILESD